ncbi:proteasome accessory factor PafA2 family protein [Chondromyces crocatus]|uniref:Uncharacterized protein n=1 Tax=Chondromyces crocatus TaxID=52 RepID=A0A0K1ERZ2_CHOCO|nr:proteasome accessory factor PafA2 family protein [Chondromyces crocatus]AKT43695.1 uncharacterized protein CMC5_079300 [Chondromyces crocatus]
MPRLLGLETELAIRFTPTGEPASARPGNNVIYQALADSVAALVQTQPGESHGVEESRLFTESGASIAYEVFPYAPSAGLVEVATPECDEAGQLVCHQRAIEALLLQAIPDASRRLSALGFEGEFTLLKNCRDAEGHIYGAQENYEVEIARGAWLWVYRVGLVLLAPLVLVEAILFWAFVVVLVTAMLLAMLGLLIAARVIPRWRERNLVDELLAEENPARDRKLREAVRVLDKVLINPGILLSAWLIRVAGFRRERRSALGFLVSRPILTGAGSLEANGDFGLSEKGPAIRAVMRSKAGPDNRPLIDTGNLIKDATGPLRARLRPYVKLFRARQRMQLGLSDANVAQVAEFLKVGVTSLVLDMVEAGALSDAPRPADPIAALHAICADPTLKVRVAIVGGEPMSALEIQRAYLAKARAFVRTSPTTSLGAHQLLRLWGDALDALEEDPAQLVGALDWVTKRTLLEGCAPDAAFAVQKKIDLRYHELGSGYFARIERAGLARRVVSDEEITTAIRTPPASTPARLRGQLVRELAGERLPVRVSWDSVRIGGRLGGKVIPLRGPRARPRR